jgi:predicted nucleotidyltransferase
VDAALSSYLDELLLVVRKRLEKELVAVSLIGGAGAGAFEPWASDVDVVVVIERPLPPETLLELAAALSHRRRPVPARRLELVVYTRAGLRDGEFALNLNTGFEIEHAGLDPAETDSFWFVLDLAIARGRSTPLLGPPLRELAPEPSRELVRAAALASLDRFAAHSPESPDTALNAARSWLWAETGQWATKGEAAEWARSRAPDPELIDAALALRRDGRPAGLDPGAVGELAARARDALRRAGPA